MSGGVVITVFDLVRKYFPNATDEECDFILWEKTAFPMGGAEMAERQLKELAESRKDADR